MRQRDIRLINEHVSALQRSLDRLEELHDLEQQDGVTVDSAEFEQAQQDAKDAVLRAFARVDDLIDRTDHVVIENDSGDSVERDLPDPAIDRNASENVPDTSGI